MDKYIEEFCQKYFSEFEEIGIKNRTDSIFDKPKIPPCIFVRAALCVGVVMIVASVHLSFEIPCKSCLIKDVGVGVLVGSIVALYLEQRNKSVQYYEKIICIIKSRMRAIKLARREANEHILNRSEIEGLRLLQYTVQNGLCFMSYLNDRMINMFSSHLAEGLEVVYDLGEDLSEEEVCQRIQIARRTISECLLRLDRAKHEIRMAMLERSV